MPSNRKYISPDYNPHNMTPRSAAVSQENRGTFNNFRRAQQNNGNSAEYQIRNNFVNQAMPTTRKALNLEKPDLGTILRDIFTVDGNLFFNHQKGDLLSISNGIRQATNNDDIAYIRPKGEWTVYGMSAQYMGTVSAIKQSLMYTLVPNYWNESEKAYIEYLLGVVETQITALKNNRSVTNANNTLQIQQNAMIQNTVIQNSPNGGNGVIQQLNPNQSKTEQQNQQQNQQQKQKQNQKQNQKPPAPTLPGRVSISNRFPSFSRRGGF